MEFTPGEALIATSIEGFRRGLDIFVESAMEPQSLCHIWPPGRLVVHCVKQDAGLHGPLIWPSRFLLRSSLKQQLISLWIPFADLHEPRSDSLPGPHYQSWHLQPGSNHYSHADRQPTVGESISSCSIPILPLHSKYQLRMFNWTFNLYLLELFSVS